MFKRVARIAERGMFISVIVYIWSAIALGVMTFPGTPFWWTLGAWVAGVCLGLSAGVMFTCLTILLAKMASES